MTIAVRHPARPAGEPARLWRSLRSAGAIRTAKIALSFLGFLLLWEALCRGLGVSDFVLPAPSTVAYEIASKAQLFAVHSLATFKVVAIGFFLAVLFGVIVAGIVVNVPSLSDIVMPILLVTQLIPKVALAPILLIWLGYGVAPKIVITFLISFFPIVVNTIQGLSSVEKPLLELARSLEASRWQIFRKFMMPVALPALFGGMKVAITLAVIGAIIGEFVGGSVGLGYLIVIANSEMNTPLAFGALLLLSVGGILLYFLVEASERFLIPWNRAKSAQPKPMGA